MKIRRPFLMLSKRSLLLWGVLFACWLSLLSPIAFAAPFWQSQTVDSASDVGLYTSLTLDSNGRPVISYFDGGNLQLAQCGDLLCSSGNVITTIDHASTVSLYTALVLDSNGYPVISYLDTTTFALNLVHCRDATCSSSPVITTVDSSGLMGEFTALALDSSGKPVIAYTDFSNNRLKLAHCGDVTCSSGNVIQIIDDAGGVGQLSTLALDSNGKPVLSYRDVNGSDFKVVRCGDVNCSSGNVIQVVDSSGLVDNYPALALDSSDKPVISYFDNTNSELTLLHCGDATCASGNSLVTIDSGVAGEFVSLALTSGGNPVLSYLDLMSSVLKVVRCGNASCSSGNTVDAIDSSGTVGWHTALALDKQDRPVLSYQENSNNDLLLARLLDSDVDAPTAAPTQSPPANGAGWNNTNVTVTWNWSDTEGLDGANCTSSSTSSGEGVLTLTATCRDTAGNLGNATYTVKVDKTAPTLTPTVSPNPVTVNGAATVTAGAIDSGAGLATATCGALDTTTAGVKSVVCTATDNAGNSATATVNYTVTATASTLYQQVQSVRATLAALMPSGHSKTDNILTKAIRKLDQNLAADLWQPDGNHFTAKGEKAFHLLRDAVKELVKVKSSSVTVTTTVNAALNNLVTISRTLAQMAITEAVAAGGKASTLAKAQKVFNKGDQERSKGKLANAISAYEEAWEYAQQAIGKAVVAASTLDAEDGVDGLDTLDEEEEDVDERLDHLSFLPLVQQ